MTLDMNELTLSLSFKSHFVHSSAAIEVICYKNNDGTAFTSYSNAVLTQSNRGEMSLLI